MKSPFLLTALATLTIALTGCETTTANNSQSSNSKSSISLSDIEQQLGCDASYQCKVIGLGERLTCGGPREYLIYSTKHSDEKQVEQLVATLTQQEQQENQSKPPAQSCEPVMPMQTLCIDNQCKPITIK